jgi:O-succinylbenzoate synthase
VNGDIRDRPFRIDGVDVRSLSLPLAAPLVTGRERYRQRDLLLLRIRLRLEGQTQHGWGEVAPLAGWNDADLD